MTRLFGRALRYLSIGGLLSAALLLASCGKGDSDAPDSAKHPPSLVNVSVAIAHDVPDYLDEIGKATASEMVTIMPRVTGRLDKLGFHDGDNVAAKQEIFKIDVSPFEAALKQANAQLDKDRAAATNADKFLQRQKELYNQVPKRVAPSDYDTAVFNNAAAQATVQADEAAVQSAQLNVDYCTIHSPITGRAGIRMLDPGNMVQMNQTPLLVIQRLDPIYADFTINERDLPVVRQQMANHTLIARVSLPTDPADVARPGDLTALDNTVQDASGTVRLRATLKNEDRHFWPGQYVNVRLILARKIAVLIPASASQISQKGPYVYVVNGESKAEMRQVVLGQQHVLGEKKELFVVVESGVKAGEQVIINGQVMVFPGAAVKVEPGKNDPTNPFAGEKPSTMPTTMPMTRPTTGPTTMPMTRPAILPPTGSAATGSAAIGSAK